MKTYKIRKFQNGKNKNGEPFLNFSLTIPSAIAEALPSDMQFSCELNDDGILFRPAKPDADAVSLPDWAQRSNGSAASEAEVEAPAKPKRSGGRKRPGAKAKEDAAETTPA